MGASFGEPPLPWRESLSEPSWVSRASVWLRRGSLDRQLARGASPWSASDLSLRAQQLVAPGFRARLAAAIRGTIKAAGRPPAGRVSSAVPLQRDAIIGERELLLRLARELAEEETVSARGVARVEELLTEGTSPLYAPSPPGALRAAVRHVRTTLLLG